MLRDIDVSYLVRKSMKREFISTRFYCNLLMFYAVKSLVQKIKVHKYYYPFENRAFEKMAVLALRKFSPATTIIGYQHAALTLKHVNFFIEKEEAEIIPLPDKIFTMGSITRGIMEKTFHFTKEILHEGCALRKTDTNGKSKSYFDKIKYILVVLSTDLKEYIGVLKFLNEAFKGGADYVVQIRPHPVIPLEDAISMFPYLTFQYKKQEVNVSLRDALNQADVVLYVSSTLTIEALAWGIPVIFLDIGDFLNTDPIFNFYDFKWVCNESSRLKRILKNIENLSKEEYIISQEKGREFANRYFYPVNEVTLEEFLLA